MLVIWAIVFNKIFSFFGNNVEENSISVNPITIVDPRMNFSKDTFNLRKVEKDPFLGKYTISRGKKRKTNTNLVPRRKKINSIPKNNINKPWPKLSYHGYVKGAKSTSELILIKMNNKFHKIREGDILEDISVKKIYRDSIIIKRSRESKTILKSK
ncbi:hypothetical protein [Aquimarina sp. MAR_2010_214]|uniref:hypothetical protein n=1 Tax=Aquimarina sp. MAR_2010_214 TaxID=1250026 RepID=UPI000C6FD9BE|nr:hypothetical protein [Aquimarina sp. MAR_2010_214]